MIIDIGDYVITHDGHQFIVNEPHIVQSGKSKGQSYLKPIRYCRNPKYVAKFLVEQSIADDGMVIAVAALEQAIDRAAQHIADKLEEATAND